MSNLLKTIQERQSTRVPFDPSRPVKREDLKQIVEAARWAPTPHNMQNFEVVLVDDKELLKRIGKIRSSISRSFVTENYRQLSFSKAELLQKKVGILGAYFPPAWRDPARFSEALAGERDSSLNDTIDGSPTILVVIYDPRKRAPASKGDFLGVLGLGCVLENMWLTANALKIGFQVMSVFRGGEVEKEVKQVLSIPSRMRIAYAARLGHPTHHPRGYMRVRRDVESIAHANHYGNRILR
jgi:nitroreductase